MKRYTVFFLACSLIWTACSSPAREKAQETANTIQALTKANSLGEVGTSPNGYFMKALIDGKPWTATSMLEFNRINDHRVYGNDGETKIAFNLDLDHIHTGIDRNFGEMFAADLLTHDDVGAWGGRKGKILITKDDGKVVEGTFYFTATTHSDANKKREVSDGFFRILLKQ